MTILNVPSNYPTINSAIAASSPGDTIVVAAGTYSEQISINISNLTLLGARAGIDARTRSFVAANESIITFASSGFGSGIVNILKPNVVFNGFTVQGNIVNSTSAIFAGNIGTFLPSTTTIDVTGLQIINNIIQHNANGILVASIEPTPLTINYLVKFNYFYDNSGNPSLGNGQGILFSNSSGANMSNVLVTQNLFAGLETSASVNFTNVHNSVISNNTLKNDNSITLINTNNITITDNNTSGATGVTSDFPSNTADAIFIGFDSINITITNNLISNATNSGIHILNGNSIITISDNCIVNNTIAGILVETNSDSINSNININNNNIGGNTTGLQVNLNSYTQIEDSLDATNNYWGSSSGPNYNNGGPGTGDIIIDNNIVGTQTVKFSPFLTNPIICPFSNIIPITITKTTTSVNVSPNSKISYTISFAIPNSSTLLQITSFSDALPILTGGGLWYILSSSPSGLFTINNVFPQTLDFIGPLPLTLTPGLYSVTVEAPTNCRDIGKIYTNTVTEILQIGDTTQTITANTTASIATCVHSSSLIKLPYNKIVSISELKPCSKIVSGNGEIVEIIKTIPCWLTFDNNANGFCVVFEKDSISPGVPSNKLIIDPIHLISPPDLYLREEYKALRLAGSYVNNININLTTWDKATGLLGNNKRYDIMMPENSCGTYIANGVVVKSLQNRIIYDNKDSCKCIK